MFKPESSDRSYNLPSTFKEVFEQWPRLKQFTVKQQV